MEDTSGNCPECGVALDVTSCSCGAPECDKCGAAMAEETESGLCAACEADQAEYKPIGIAAVLDDIMRRFDGGTFDIPPTTWPGGTGRNPDENPSK